MAPGASRSPRPCRGAEVPGDPGGAAAADAASAAGGGWSAVGWRSGGAWGDGAWGEGGDQWSDSGWQGGCGGAWGEGEDQWSSSSWQGGGGGQGEEAGAAAGHEEGWEPWYIDAHDLALQPRGQGGHRFTLVLLHACSGGPDDWLPIVHRLSVPFRSSVRVVVPCAPVRREEHGGWIGEMNSWFEYSEDGERAKHPEQLEEQRSRLLALLERERALLPGGDPRRLVIGGLSQGVALAVDVALRAPFTVGGVLALRGSVLPECLTGAPPARPAAPGAAPRALQVMAFHGERDRQCPLEAARAGYEGLRIRGAHVRIASDPELGHACARGRQRLSRMEAQHASAFLEELWGSL